MFSFTKKFELRREDSCGFVDSRNSSYLLMRDCDNNIDQQWFHNKVGVNFKY